MKLIPILGLMSGTSMDGIDACVLKTNGKKFERTGINHIHPYSHETNIMLQKFNKNRYSLINNNLFLKKLEFLITQDHILCTCDLLKKYKLKPLYIGFHGQTIFHEPQKKSIQLGDGQYLANQTKIDVICNFRTNDIKNGGHGAPIAPVYHKALIEDINLNLPACFLNIGGISNLTYWDGSKLIGFDVGPGNTLIDTFVNKKYNLKFDHNGNLARSGKPNKAIISQFLKNKFFKKTYPKSLDKFYFNEIFYNNIFTQLNSLDALSTLTHLTAESINLSLKLLPKKIKSLIVCGGGQNNNYLIEILKDRLNCKVYTSDEINLPGDMIEAEMIAYISARSIENLEFTYPGTTGVKKPCKGGDLFLAKN